jgi:tRNA G18 (ribose-2'-O)-methylase SpoU
MKTKRIYSKNADYQKFEVLKTNRNKRHRYGEFLVEGVRNINEAARCGWAFRSFLYAHGRALSLWAQGLLENVRTDVNCELSPELMEELSGKQDTSELLAVVGMRKENAFAWELSPAPLLALFDRPSNHGNLGAVMRSCDALGVEGLLVTGHAVDPYDPDTVAASMGSFFRLKFAYFPDNQTADGFIAGMREKYPGFITVGTSAHAETRLRDVDLTKPRPYRWPRARRRRPSTRRARPRCSSTRRRGREPNICLSLNNTKESKNDKYLLIIVSHCIIITLWNH